MATLTSVPRNISRFLDTVGDGSGTKLANVNGTSAAFTFTAATTDIVTAVAHGLVTGDGPFRVTNSGGALPTGLAALTDYWIVRLTDDTFKLATSYANAVAATPVVVDITATGSGTHTLHVPTRFKLKSPASGVAIINSIILNIGDTEFVNTGYGAVAALTHGIRFYVMNGNIFIQDLTGGLPIKSTAEALRFGAITYPTIGTVGNRIGTITMPFNRLLLENGQSVEMFIQDDLTGLVQHTAYAYGNQEGYN